MEFCICRDESMKPSGGGGAGKVCLEQNVNGKKSQRILVQVPDFIPCILAHSANQRTAFYLLPSKMGMIMLRESHSSRIQKKCKLQNPSFWPS